MSNVLGGLGLNPGAAGGAPEANAPPEADGAANAPGLDSILRM